MKGTWNAPPQPLGKIPSRTPRRSGKPQYLDICIELPAWLSMAQCILFSYLEKRNKNKGISLKKTCFDRRTLPLTSLYTVYKS